MAVRPTTSTKVCPAWAVDTRAVSKPSATCKAADILAALPQDIQVADLSRNRTKRSTINPKRPGIQFRDAFLVCIPKGLGSATVKIAANRMLLLHPTTTRYTLLQRGPVEKSYKLGVVLLCLRIVVIASVNPHEPLRP